MRIELETGARCDYASTELGLHVLVANVGAGCAGPFVLEANGARQATYELLNAGAEKLFWFTGGYVWPGENHAYVDVDHQVVESNEGNNELVQWLPIPTLPLTCTPASTATTTPTLTPTVTATAELMVTPTATAIPTDTPTATPTETATPWRAWLPLLLKS